MSQPADACTLPDVLVAEPDVLLRRAVKQVAGEVGIARVHETSDIHGAVREMELRPFSALVIALDREELAEQPVFFGGPVQTERGFVLHEKQLDGTGPYNSTMSVRGGLSGL
jgi:hypothetical protein